MDGKKSELCKQKEMKQNSKQTDRSLHNHNAHFSDFIETGKQANKLAR